MLPSLPKSQKLVDEAFHKRMFAARSKVIPHAVHPPSRKIVEGKTTDYQCEDRQVKPLEMKLHQVKVEVDISDGKGMSLEELHAKADEIGESFGKQMWEMLHDAVSEAVAETGNEVTIRNGVITKEAVLQMLSMGEDSYDEKGEPTGRLILHPEMLERFKLFEQEHANDKDFLEQVAQIKRRKREAFDGREARRRLVD